MAAPEARIRAFVAIEIGDTARVACAQLIERLRPMPARVAWVRPENLHLTLRFLGDVSEAQIEPFVDRARSEIHAHSPFEAVLRGVGAFPNPRRPSVIWTGFESEGNTAATLNAITESAARTIGLESETRAFVPHVTLGRVRRDGPKSNIAAHLEREQDFATDAFTVDAVSLFSSELTPQGARYTRLHRLTFDGLRRARGV